MAWACEKGSSENDNENDNTHRLLVKIKINIHIIRNIVIIMIAVIIIYNDMAANHKPSTAKRENQHLFGWHNLLISPNEKLGCMGYETMTWV